MSLDEIELYHHNLRRLGYQPTSPADPRYNCVAWAAERTDRWWDHSGEDGTYWPEGIPREDGLENYIAVFHLLGYESCESPDLELGYQKVAIYAKGGEFQHVARLQETGMWTSKMGALEDIEHATLNALEDPRYGRVVQILRRPLVSEEDDDR